MAGIAVSAAEPSGLWGTLKEFLASSSALDAAKRDPHSNELVAAVIAELETEEGQSKLHKALHKRFAEVKNPAGFVQNSLVALREASAILDEREPADAAAFKSWLFSVSRRVAEAASEGGFLGFGGVQVIAAERATLGDIAEALGNRRSGRRRADGVRGIGVNTDGSRPPGARALSLGKRDNLRHCTRLPSWPACAKPKTGLNNGRTRAFAARQRVP